jgi:sec-independent protein translocase protein TatA
MLGLDNPIHIAFILILLLLVFGAKRLPEMGKSLGSGLRGFKESLTGEENVHELRPEQDPQPIEDVTAATPARPAADQHAPVQPAA